jgi:F-type H+-transporting ATPase subunit epsilon
LEIVVAQTFQCTLVTPQRQVLDQPVAYASVPAWDGLVGIAPQRAPLLVRLGDGPLRLDLPEDAGGQSMWFFVGGGFAQMKDNRLTILADEAVPADEISAETARAALAAAASRIAVADDEVRGRDRDRSRAMHMLHVLEQAEV